jgi:tetratricopeptide (TPR) repeat protein
MHVTVNNQDSGSMHANLERAWACFDEGRLDAAIELARLSMAQAPVDQPHASAALGWFLLSAGSETEAESILTSSLVRHPAYAPLHWYLGLVFVRQSRREEACQALATSVAIDPELSEAAVALAWQLSDLGRFEEAVTYCRMALAKNAQPDTKAQLGWLLVCLQQWEEAARQLTEVVDLEPARKDSRVHLATALLRLGRSDEALKTLEDGLQLLPGATELLEQKTHLLIELRRTVEARAACHRLLKLQPQNGLSWYLLALVLVQRKRSVAAARILARARRLEPERPEIWHQTSCLALESGDLKTALDAVEQLVALAPNDSANQVLAALVLEANGDLSSASAHAEMAVAQDSRSAQAWHTLAKMRYRQSQLNEAEEALKTALDLGPKVLSDTYKLLGWVYFSDHRFGEAVKAFSDAVESQKDDANSWYGLATAYRATGDSAQALQSAQSALRLHHDWPTALTLLGCILIDNGPDYWNESVLQLSRSLRLDPSQEEARYHLSTVLHRLERNDEALGTIAEGLTLNPRSINLLHQEIQLLLDLHRTADARSVCHSALKLQSLNGMSWLWLARVLVKRKQRGMAVRALCRAVRRSPDSIELLRQAGWLALECRDLRVARDCAERVLALEHGNPANDILAAVVLEACGDLTAASVHAEVAVSKAKDSGQAWRALAQIRTRQGRQDEAKDALHTALVVNEINANDTWRQLGWLFLDERNFGMAITAFQNAVNHSTNDASAWYGLAQAYRSDGNYLNAMQAIKHSLSLRDEWNDCQLRGQILHEQIYGFLKKKWSALDGSAQPLLRQAESSAVQDSCSESILAGDDEAVDTKEPTLQAVTKKYEYVVCSLSTRSHVPLMNTFAHSVRKHFAGRIYLLVVDSDDPNLVPEGTTLVRLSDVIEPETWQKMVQRYNILELCCALKSYLVRFLARTVGCPIFYMDADTYLVGPLDALLPQRPNFSVFLTPHLLYPFSGDPHAEEIGMLCVGVYNGGMIGVGLSDDGIRFLDWWQDRVTRYAYDSREQGVFTDQKWLDLVPCFFKGVHVSRAIGLNLGHWRVCSERDFTYDVQEKLTFCGEPVTLMHMSGFKSDKPELLAQHLRPAVTQNSPLGNFLQRYAIEVNQNKAILNKAHE